MVKESLSSQLRKQEKEILLQIQARFGVQIASKSFSKSYQKYYGDVDDEKANEEAQKKEHDRENAAKHEGNGNEEEKGDLMEVVKDKAQTLEKPENPEVSSVEVLSKPRGRPRKSQVKSNLETEEDSPSGPASTASPLRGDPNTDITPTLQPVPSAAQDSQEQLPMASMEDKMDIAKESPKEVPPTSDPMEVVPAKRGRGRKRKGAKGKSEKQPKSAPRVVQPMVPGLMEREVLEDKAWEEYISRVKCVYCHKDTDEDNLILCESSPSSSTRRLSLIFSLLAQILFSTYLLSFSSRFHLLIYSSYFLPSPMIKLPDFCRISYSLLVACDGAAHTYCHKPPLYTVPEGDWYCFVCIKILKVCSYSFSQF